jgi:dihydroorotate dehydrogenase
MSFRVSHRLFSKAGGYPTISSGTRTLFTGSAPYTVRNILSATALVTGATLLVVYYFDSRSAIHRYVFAPLLRTSLDAETSHKTAVKILRTGWAPKDTGVDDECLAVEVCLSPVISLIGPCLTFKVMGRASLESSRSRCRLRQGWRRD